MAKGLILIIKNNIRMKFGFKLGIGLLKGQSHLWIQFLRVKFSGVNYTILEYKFGKE
jgi:hypothetical protein